MQSISNFSQYYVLTRQALAKESILDEKTITEQKKTGAISREKIAAVVSYVHSHACDRSTVVILPWQQLTRDDSTD